MINPRFAELIQYLLLFMLVVLVYQCTLAYDFVYDDYSFIVDNQTIREWSQIPSFFSDPTTFSNDPENSSVQAWRPLRNISFFIDFQLFRLRPSGWHLHNILLHGVVSLLVLYLFRSLTKAFIQPHHQHMSLLYAWFFTAMWALHPANTEVVGWIKSRDDLLATLFALTSIIFFCKAFIAHSLQNAIISSLALIGSLLSKESAACLPFISIALSLTATAANQIQNQVPTADKHITRRLPWVLFTFQMLIVLSYVGLRDWLLGQTSQSPYIAGNFSSMMATMTLAIIRYGQILLWPFYPTVQSADYSTFPIAKSWTTPPVLVCTLCLVIICLILLKLARRSYLILAGTAFLFFSALPILNIIPMMQVLAERFLYLPGIGAAFILHGLATYMLIRFDGSYRNKTLIFLVLVLISLTERTMARLPAWENNSSFYDANLAYSPDSSKAIYEKAYFLWREGETSQSLILLNQSLPRKNDSLRLETLRVNILLTSGLQAKAEEKLLDLNKQNPNNPRLLMLLYHMFLGKGELDNARSAISKLVEITPRDPHAWYNLAYLDYRNGDTTKALSALENALHINTNFQEANQLHRKIARHTAE